MIKLNRSSDPVADLLICCGSRNWAHKVAQHLPVTDVAKFRQQVADTWMQCSETDWLEAFSHHPRIGEAVLREKFGASADLSQKEQSGIAQASSDTIRQLAQLNQTYFETFGFIFIICATGLDPETMLAALKERLNHTRSEELLLAAQEQLKITLIRLEPLL
ncbi:MAG: 2-oxo-4-hydroxy-4-carboxy-5-ureidoimidazoline decarboxylase [Acidobacteria bacterium]|nr:2-oxo-4-hydroxy-4-carboxy-5-ureidoimidazoline decarboxylase [Acidobacteriota bacterium]